MDHPRYPMTQITSVLAEETVPETVQQKQNAGEDTICRSRSPFANKPVVDMVVEKTGFLSHSQTAQSRDEDIC